jgi:hypothetical protein
MEGFGEWVFSADAGNHGVAASLPALGDQFAEEEFADAVADAVRADVDGVLDG